jgi:hypothetical protein
MDTLHLVELSRAHDTVVGVKCTKPCSRSTLLFCPELGMYECRLCFKAFPPLEIEKLFVE